MAITAGRILTVLCLVQLGLAGDMKNKDFEEPFGYTNWFCAGCVAVSDSDAYSGSTSLLASERQAYWAGPRQVVTEAFQLGVRYHLSVAAKIVLTEGHEDPVDLVIGMQYVLDDGEGGEVRKYDIVAEQYDMTREDGWVKLAAEFTLTDYDMLITELQMYVVQAWQIGSAPWPNFLVDDFEKRVINQGDDWMLPAQTRMQQIRMSNLTLAIRGWSGTEDMQGATVKIEQLESQFGLGASVDAFLLTYNDEYRDTFLQNFGWGVLETDMSWRETEYSKNVLTWEAADAGIHILEAHNKRVRGGIIHESGQEVDTWSENMPQFLKEVELPDDIYRFSMKRVDDLLGRYRYRCEHWDVVNNMMKRDNFMLDTFGDEKIFTDLYKRSKEVDYAAKLFVNHDGLITNGFYIQLVVDEVKRLRENGAPVDGIGVNAVFADAPSGDLILERLDRLSEAGVPVWITGYAYSNTNESRRAEASDDFMLAVRSHSSVEGVMMRDFWDGHIDEDEADSALFEGSDLTDCCAPALNYTECFTQRAPPLFTDCQDAFERGQRDSGKMYYIRPLPSTRIIKAVCQFDSTSGWTVIQRRLDGSVDFYRYWDDYVRGFGSLEGEYWIGLDAINYLTETNRKLSIYLESHDGEIRTANYSTWYIDGADTEYVMHVSGYDGDAGDSLTFHDNMAFSTQDNDNDHGLVNCAVEHSGAWWYNSCFYSSLNGLWFEGGSAAVPQYNAAAWYHWLGHTYSLKTIYMRLSRDP